MTLLRPTWTLDELRASLTEVRRVERQEMARISWLCHVDGRRALSVLSLFVALVGILEISVRAASSHAFFPSSEHFNEESPMRFSKSLAVVSSMVVASGAFAQEAVQWRVEDGGNGHWYAVDSTQRQWSASRILAEALGGHLATLTTLAEQNFVENLPGIDEEGCAGPAIGLIQSPIGAEPGGGWSWITGEPLVFTTWGAIPGYGTNPDDTVGGPPVGVCDVGTLWCPPWHDWDDSLDASDYTSAALIEWSADCNSDGIVDYGQIRAGELEDSNGNNIPDCCDQSVSCAPCLADIDDSGAVNGVDLSIILNSWGSNGGKYPRADINADGEVNGIDLALVLGNWGTCP